MSLSNEDQAGQPKSRIQQLKIKHKFFANDENLETRRRRCFSWLEQAEKEIGARKFDEAFIFCWIAFNAAYSVNTFEARESFVMDTIKHYIKRLIELDDRQSIAQEIFDNQNRWTQIEAILDNQYIIDLYWKAEREDYSGESWQAYFSRKNNQIGRAYRSRNPGPVLEELFSRLYVLRNQLMHGGATYQGDVNRLQVEYGAVIVYWLLPIFLDIMFSNPHVDWGPPEFPSIPRNPN